MYLDFYHLNKAPFHITPDPEFLFLSPSHKAALGSIIYGIEERQGFVAISGEVGLGKTTILRSYLERVDPRFLKTIYIFNANVSFRALLKAIFGEFGLDYETEDLFEMVNHLHQVLIDEYKQGRNVALIIDEAQNMSVETLENLRMLSNLETNTEKLVQIILIGQPEFDQKLNLNELRQLKQRLVIRSTIEPLTEEESLAYVYHRLDKAASQGEPIFTKRALKEIVGKARGAPRVLNILCTNTLIAGFGYRQRPITGKTAREVIAEFEGKKRLSIFKPALAFSAIVLLCAGIFWMSSYKDKLLDTLDRIAFFQDVADRLRGSQDNVSSVPKAPHQDAIDTASPDSEATSSEGYGQDLFDINLPMEQPKPEENLATEWPQGIDEQQPDVVDSSEWARRITKPQISTLDNSDSGNRSEEITPPNDAEVLPEPSEAQEDIFPVIRIVKKGEYVSKLAAEVYGFTNNAIIESIKKHNPQIQNIDKVEVGDKVLFPELHVSRE